MQGPTNVKHLSVYFVTLCCLLQVSASKGDHRANIYKKKLKMQVRIVQKVN